MNNFEWFKTAGFGIMVHFGLYTVLEGEYKGKPANEWVRRNETICKQEYHKLAEAFNPLYFNADEWIKAVKESGAKYFVITAKRHEGFALFDSKASDFNVVKATPFKRDIIREISESCKKYDIKLGLYYSHDLDWEEPDAGGFIENQWCYPANNVWDYNKKEIDMQSYIDRKVKPQLTELLTNYGDLLLIWFDFPVTVSKKQSQELYDLVKSIQPDCLAGGSLGNGITDITGGGDNQIDMNITDTKPAEVPATLSGTGDWGFSTYCNMKYKTAEEINKIKDELNAKGINLLLNVGPDHLGRFPGPALEVLKNLPVKKITSL